MTRLDPSVPIYGLLGLDVDVVADGKAVGRMLVTDHHYSQVERMHGGLVFVVFDTVMGWAVRSLLEPGTDLATVDISMRFIRMVCTGQLRVEAEVYHPGRRIMQVRAEAYEHRNKLAATATGAFAVFGDDG